MRALAIRWAALLCLFCPMVAVGCGDDDADDGHADDHDATDATDATDGGQAGGAGASSRSPAAGNGSGQRQGAAREDRVCPTFEACGGDPEGTWTVKDVCLNNGRELFASTIGPACASAYQAASVQGEGRYELAEGQASSQFELNTSVVLAFDDSCIQSILGKSATAASQCANLAAALSRDPNFASVACDVEDAKCVCELTAPELSSGDDGAYQVRDNELIIDGKPVPFCIDGETMTIKPTLEGATVTITLGK